MLSDGWPAGDTGYAQAFWDTETGRIVLLSCRVWQGSDLVIRGILVTVLVAMY